jgi:lipoprotein-releasing system ATP-binding protein
MIIEATGIHKSFGTLEVLKGVDFSAEKGEVVSIMGASGAGKTTLLQILGTLMTPDSGELRIDGKNALGLKERELAAFRGREIGFVFQAHHLLPEFTAFENVMIPAMIAGGRTQSQMKAAAEEVLSRVGLWNRLNHRPAELSGGEQQRVAIARALINDPAVLLADEPTGNLDSATKQEIHQLFFDLREQLGQTIIIVTHDPDLAALCDRELHMVDGRFM